MLVKTKGYLLSRQDYQDFDEIITFINEHGIVFTCFCSGTRKILSKNGRNLDYANFIEFEFFLATNNDKMSRLKKANCLNYVDNKHKHSYSLLMLNEYIKKIFPDKKIFFEFYQKIIYFLISDVNDYLIMLFICIYIYKLSGITINFSTCYNCGSNKNIKTINLVKKCGVCNRCQALNGDRVFKINELKLWHKIQTTKLTHCDLNGIDEYDVDEIKIIIKLLINFIYEELGIFSSLLNEI